MGKRGTFDESHEVSFMRLTLHFLTGARRMRLAMAAVGEAGNQRPNRNPD